EVTILHSASAVIFGMEERGRGYHINSAVAEIGKWTTLKKNEVYTEHFTKSDVFTVDKDEDYLSFVNDFLHQDGFPAGYYIVTGTADFFFESENDDEQQYFEIEAKVDFKVR